MTTIEIFKALQLTTKTKEKQEILQLNKDNKFFKRMLYFLLNPYIVTGISNKKINKVVNIKEEVEEIDDMDKLIEYLSVHNTGTDKDILIVQKYINSMPQEMHEFLKSFITKTLKIGIDAKTVNKVYGKGFIPTFDVMLANKYFDNTDKVKGKDFTLTTKLDGFRAIITKHNREVTIYSRQGQIIKGLVDIENELINSASDVVIDGELIISDTKGLSNKEIYKATSKILRKDGIKQGITFHAFDCLFYEMFVKQNAKNFPYFERRIALERNFGGFKHIKVLPRLYTGNDISIIEYYLKLAREDNQEGIMININSADYEFKRTNNLLKCKVMQDADLFVTGIYEGTGRNKGKLGGITVKFIYEDKEYECNCGSGFSDLDREFYWKRPEMILNKIVTIQYFEITKNQKGGIGLRFPVFTGRIRNDKTEISMN